MSRNCPTILLHFLELVHTTMLCISMTWAPVLLLLRLPLKGGVNLIATMALLELKSSVHSCRKGLYNSKFFCNIFWSQHVPWALNYPMKHVLYFFDARKASKIDLFWARADIYVVNFDKSVFIEGVIFRNLHNNIKCVVWNEDSRFQRILL